MKAVKGAMPANANSAYSKIRPLSDTANLLPSLSLDTGYNKEPLSHDKPTAQQKCAVTKSLGSMVETQFCEAKPGLTL